MRRAASLFTMVSVGLVATTRSPAEKRLTLLISVHDEQAAPIASATLNLSASDGTLLATAQTDAGGRRTLRLTTPDTLLSLIVRKIGFAPTTQSIPVRTADTIEIDVGLIRQATELDTVRATSRMLSNNYTLNADEIANSRRSIRDAYDALRDLRPSMLGDRMRNCPYVQNLWVNGRPLPVFASEIVPMNDLGQSPRDDGSGRPVLRSHTPSAHAPPDAPLAMVKPQYIAQMRYVNCYAKPQAGTRSLNALFIDLKPGIGFDLKRGTYVADTVVARAAKVIP